MIGDDRLVDHGRLDLQEEACRFLLGPDVEEAVNFIAGIIAAVGWSVVHVLRWRRQHVRG
jgi:hypothetical protein